jgi:general secretion pathway protein D
MSYVNELVRQYFSAAGVDLGGTNTLGGGAVGGGIGGFGAGFQNAAGKAVFWNDRTGILLVRATLQDLDIIDAAIQALNQTPDQVTIEAKFVEIGQDDARALGFDWWVGNWNMGSGIGGQAGTAPSYAGAPSAANPFGVFPGTFGQGSQAPNPSTDGKLTSGLRSQIAGGQGVPTVGTITGIMTDPQFRMVIKALDQRAGVDILSAPKVTTVSGRQAQIQIIDIQSIVVFNQAGAFGGGVGGVGGAGVGGVVQ